VGDALLSFAIICCFIKRSIMIAILFDITLGAPRITEVASAGETRTLGDTCC
jgi:hypothetical protein